MSAAIATPTVGTGGWADQRYHHNGSVAISASPATYTTGGIAFNLDVPLIKASRTPSWVEIFGISGYTYVYVKGVDNSTGLLKIFVQDGIAGNPLAEMANALAIPAGVSGDTISFYAIWKGME
jgi:hypothetical protein